MHVLPYYRQVNLAPSVTKFCANLKQKTQILPVLIEHANILPIGKVQNTVVQSVNR